MRSAEVAKADAAGLIQRALDLGINYFDTADSYGNQARFDRPGATAADQLAALDAIARPPP